MVDRRVRLALNYAIDKETIARTLYKGYGQPIGQIVPPDSVMYDDALKPTVDAGTEASPLRVVGVRPAGFSAPDCRSTR